MSVNAAINTLRARVRTQRSAPRSEWRFAEVPAKMWDLGFTAFGGPPVHFQILHRRFVEGEGHLGAKWLDEQTVCHP